ncbi:MAG: class I SAM-dependent methyltransferase [Candidatus Falkowbacteria bacterium]
MNKKTQDKILNIVKVNYSDIATEFNTTRKKFIWSSLNDFSREIKPGSRVLDVGCGNGRLIEVLEDKQINYLGVDNSRGLIKLAGENYPNYKFLVSDILSLNQFADKNFDYIFSIAVLHHLPGQKLQIEGLKQMADKLAPRGRIIISVWSLWFQPKYLKLIISSYFKHLFSNNKLDFGDILFFWKNSKGTKVSLRYYHAFTVCELKKISRKANLKIVKIIKDKFNYYLVLEKD